MTAEKLTEKGIQRNKLLRTISIINKNMISKNCLFIAREHVTFLLHINKKVMIFSEIYRNYRISCYKKNLR